MILYHGSNVAVKRPDLSFSREKTDFANDKVIQTLQLYFREVITAEDAIGRLRYNKPNYQYCFKNQEVIKGITIREAFDALYRSRLYAEIRSGVSDMHCRSDGYLAEELLRETE